MNKLLITTTRYHTLLSALFVAVLCSGLAYAQNKFYLTGEVGYNVPGDISYKDKKNNFNRTLESSGGFGGGVGVGYRINKLDLEARWAYAQFAIDSAVSKTKTKVSSDYSTNNFLMGAKLSPFEWQVQPWVGLDLGYAAYNFKLNDSYDGYTAKLDGGSFIGELRAGADYRIDNRFSLGASYGYLINFSKIGTSKIELDGVHYHSLMVSGRLNF